MFEALSKERVQLCLTLAEGADRVSVYLAVSAGAWPVGLVPGFCTVQVRRRRGSAPLCCWLFAFACVVCVYCSHALFSCDRGATVVGFLGGGWFSGAWGCCWSGVVA